MSGTDAVPYEYVVLRCVPRADREEFVNVGVALHCRDSDLLGVRWHVDEARLAALWPALDPEEVRTSLRFAQAVAEGDAAGAGAAAAGPISTRFGFLKAPRSTVVRPGPVHGGVTEDPVACLDRLLAVLVAAAAGPAPTQTGTSSTAPTA
ncbi:DUF3037 domain-containing protein [Nocardioides lentus]|uniref:DUF3037 domain-containing protein n=1 Tax=Nocardioides lentus TaxID=338077 RepID=A0ABN2PPJ6_9ACTN